MNLDSLSQKFRFGAPQMYGTVICLSVGSLMAFALFLEHIQGLAPCPLCMMQRLWMLLVGILSFIALAHRPGLGIYPLLCAMASLVGGGFSIRQLWLQSLPVDQHPACGPGFEYMLESFPLSEVLVAMTSGTGDCAQVSWTFLGLSIPAWTLVGFCVLLTLSILHFRSTGKN